MVTKQRIKHWDSTETSPRVVKPKVRLKRVWKKIGKVHVLYWGRCVLGQVCPLVKGGYLAYPGTLRVKAKEYGTVHAAKESLRGLK